MHTELWYGSLRERDDLEDLVLDGKIILKCIWMGMDWIDLAENRKMWRGLVRAVMNFRVV